MKAIYSTGCNMMIFALCIAASCISQAISYSDDASSEAVDDVTKGNLEMLRLARGLQMLRLGKRLPKGIGQSEQVYSLRQLLQALIAQPRDDTRRQPPVPRYGRNLDSMEKPGKDLYLFPEVYRPAPRGGRYRRANLGSLPGLFLTSGHEAPLSLRTVVRPRIGRYLDNLSPPQEGAGHGSESAASL